MKKITFEELMQKFQFHNTSVHFHAEVAKRIGDTIRNEHADEAKDSGYFHEDFFNTDNQEASDSAS